MWPSFWKKSRHRNAFRITVPPRGELTGHRWIPFTKGLWVFSRPFDQPNARLSAWVSRAWESSNAAFDVLFEQVTENKTKQNKTPHCRWLETPWSSRDVTNISNPTAVFKTQSKKLSVLLPWISNHKHKIEENLLKSFWSSSKVVCFG